MEKEYTNGEVTIVWEHEKRTHAAVYAKGLPEVVMPREKPWIQMGAVSSKDIEAQVKMCPSGALSLKNKS